MTVRTGSAILRALLVRPEGCYQIVQEVPESHTVSSCTGPLDGKCYFRRPTNEPIVNAVVCVKEGGIGLGIVPKLLTLSINTRLGVPTHILNYFIILARTNTIEIGVDILDSFITPWPAGVCADCREAVNYSEVVSPVLLQFRVPEGSQLIPGHAIIHIPANLSIDQLL